METFATAGRRLATRGSRSALALAAVLLLLPAYRHRRGFTNGFPTEFGLFGLTTLDRRPKRALAAMQALGQAEIDRSAP
jgi:hypothetical protein